MAVFIWIVIGFALLAVVFGGVHWARREIRASREGLSRVDRSKLKDVDKDAWGEEEREAEQAREDAWKS